MIVNPGGSSNPENAGRIREIKQWVNEKISLSDETTVMVTELRCTEPGCPPLETVIAIMEPEKPLQQHKIHKPVVEVEIEDILEIAGERSPGD